MQNLPSTDSKWQISTNRANIPDLKYMAGCIRPTNMSVHEAEADGGSLFLYVIGQISPTGMQSNLKEVEQGDTKNTVVPKGPQHYPRYTNRQTECCLRPLNVTLSEPSRCRHLFE